MQKETITQIVQHVFDANATVVNTFNNGNHIEFILIKNHLREYSLIWLPITLDTCINFRVNMNIDKFINRFQNTPQQNRITYLLENFILSSYYDIPLDHSKYLQTRINFYHGVHN